MSTDAAFWNNLADEYAAKPVENPDAFTRKIAITRDLIRPEHTVLDIGCGTGSLALRLASTGAQLHGLDLSSEMIRIAREKTAADGAPNVQFHVGPFDESFTALEPGSLDGICAYSFLHLVADRTAALDQIFALLKPGGFFVSSTVCIGESWLPWAPVLAAMRWVGKAPLVKVITVQTVLDEIRDAGFERVERREVGAKARTAFAVAHKPAAS